MVEVGYGWGRVGYDRVGLGYCRGRARYGWGWEL